MKKPFIIFITLLIIAGGGWLWNFYNQPLLSWKEAQNWPNQNPVVAPASLLPSFVARGTEPFWALTLGSWMLTWEAPWATWVDTLLYTGLIQVTSWAIYTFVDGTSTITAVLTPGTCSDGMSETVYSGSAIVAFTTGPVLPLYSGCAIW